MTARLRVLGLVTYPQLAAGTRFRVLQYVPLLAEQGIDLDVRPFLSNRVFAGLYDRRNALKTAAGLVAATARRLMDVTRLSSYDVVFVQAMAALVGPPVVEQLAARLMPLVLDLDDSTYRDRPSPVYGSFARALKWPGKTDQLIRWASHVVCGNPTVAEYVRSQGVGTSVLPTIVDLDQFRPRCGAPTAAEPVVGWMGTHSTWPYFATMVPVLRKLAERHRFRLRIVGAGMGEVSIDGVEVERLPWRLEKELEYLQSFDVAVYPIIDDDWAQGKSGFKAVQYLSCGVPYVASPVGVVREIGVAGVTHLEASSEDEWVDALSRLLADADLRQEMGRRGREYAEAHYSTRRAADLLATVFRNVAKNRTVARRVGRR